MALTQEQVTLISVAAFGVTPGEHSKYFLNSDAAGKFLIGSTGKQIHEVLDLKEPLTGTAAVAAVLAHEYNYLVITQGLEEVSNAEFVKNTAKNLGAELGAENSKTLAVDLASGMPRYEALVKFAEAEAEKAGGIEKVAGVITALENDKTIDSVAEDLRGSAVKPETPNKPEVDGKTYVLKEGRDVETGTGDNDLFIADVGQNQNGAIANSLSTGDRLDGGAGRDTLEATLIEDSVVDHGLGIAPRPITNNIEEVKIEALESVALDATRMVDVDYFESNFSRDNLTIENINIRGANIKVTNDVKFGIKDVQYNAGFHAKFDTESLTAKADSTTGSQLRINLMDLGTEANPYSSAEPLGQLNVNGFRFNIDGVAKTIVSEAIDAAKTYAELFAAVQVALVEATKSDSSLEGLQVSLEKDAFNTGTYGGIDGDSIVISDKKGRELKGKGFVQEGDTTEFTLYGRFSDEEPIFTGNLIETTLTLDNAGRGSMAGHVSIGGASNSDEGVDKINLIVNRDSKIKSLNVADFSKAKGTRDLQEIELTSGVKAGSLTIGTIEDVQIFNATAFEGENLVLENINLLDAQDHYYNTSKANSTMTFNLKGDGNQKDSNLSSDANFSLNVVTAGGNDEITINTNYTIDAYGKLTDKNGSDSQFIDHLNQMNVKVTTGGGADIVTTQGYGAAIIDTGAGNDWIRTDNSGDFAKFLLNGDTSGSGKPALEWGSSPADSVVGGGNKSFQMFKTKVQVEFLGVKSDWIEIKSDKYLTTSRDINDAIKAAIKGDNELSKLLKFTDTRNEALVVESLVDRFLATDGSDFNINFLAPRMSDGTNAVNSHLDYKEQATVSNGDYQKAWESYVDSTWGGGSNAPTANPFNGLTTEAGVQTVINSVIAGVQGNQYVTDAAHQQNGSNSSALTYNVVNAGGGDDVIVLSSNVNDGIDKVVFTGEFGHDTIVNFNTNSGGGTSGDLLDFTDYLDKAANGRGTSANIKTNITEQSVQFNYSGFSANTAVSGSFAHHNTISAIDLSKLWSGIGASKPKSFLELTIAHVKASLEAGNTTSGYTTANIGMKSVLLVAKDQVVNQDGTLGAAATVKDEAIVFVVTVTGVDKDGKVTFDVQKKGSFQLAKAFSDLNDLSANDFAGTAEAIAAEAIVKANIEGVELPSQEALIEVAQKAIAAAKVELSKAANLKVSADELVANATTADLAKAAAEKANEAKVAAEKAKVAAAEAVKAAAKTTDKATQEAANTELTNATDAVKEADDTVADAAEKVEATKPTIIELSFDTGAEGLEASDAGTDAEDTFVVVAGQTFEDLTTVNITDFGTGDKINLKGAYVGGFDIPALGTLVTSPADISVNETGGLTIMLFNAPDADNIDTWVVNVAGEAIDADVIAAVNDAADAPAALAGVNAILGEGWFDFA